MAKRTAGLSEENAADGQSESPTDMVDAFTASPLQDQVNTPRPRYFIRDPLERWGPAHILQKSMINPQSF